MKQKLSIVIPNYNGSDFLCCCLDSIFSQIVDGCEVVLVDDGSTDSSVEMVKKKFCDEIERGQLKLICNENSGPGEARNAGVRASTGKYIAFADSDDYILPRYIESVFGILENHAPDIIQFNVLRVSEESKIKKRLLHCHKSSEGLYRLSEVRADIFGVGKWFPCSRAFKADIARDHPFPAERSFYEDLATIPYIFLKDASIYLCDEPLYVYRDNPQGTTRNHKPSHAHTLLGLFWRASALPPSLARDLMRVQIARSIVFFAMELRLAEIPLDELRREIRELKKKSMLATYLSMADQLFLRFPLLYTVIEWVRKRC